MSYLLHDHVLAASYEVSLRLNDGLQEFEVLHVSALRLDALHEVLDHTLSHLAAQHVVVLKDRADRPCLQQLWQQTLCDQVTGLVWGSFEGDQIFNSLR